MSKNKILYILIGVFCVFAVIAGIYAQFISTDKENLLYSSGGDGGNDNTITEKDAGTIRAQFEDLFTNTINLNNYDTTGIQKLKPEEEIVYTAYDITKEEEAYEINIKIPVLNIKGEVISTFNGITQALFANKASEVLAKKDTTSKTIYSIDYVGYVNGNILSLVIRSTLKEGDSPQRVMIQTYNYNLATNEQASLTDLITFKNINVADVNNKIQEVVQEADAEAKAIQSMGYNQVFTRDLSNQMYTVDNASVYFLGPNQELYIIYAYGNQNFTSEVDIVLIE